LGATIPLGHFRFAVREPDSWISVHVKEGVPMSSEAPRPDSVFSSFEQLRFARDVLCREGEAILQLADRLQDEFCQAVAMMAQCAGSVIVTGMGKAGLVGQKIAATLASTGTNSHFLHPGEAVHGDLGRIGQRDLLLVLSFSGETEEITRLLASLEGWRRPMIAMTSSPESTLGRAAEVTLALGPLEEACSLGLAPSTSTTAMLALGDALALVISRMKRFKATDFARFHPGGSLGQKLARVEDVMRPLQDCRVAAETDTVRGILVKVSRPGRRTGAIMLTNEDGRLTGLFTDSDLARMLEHNRESALDDPMTKVMTRHPTTVPPGTLLPQAIDLMADRKISELPVVDVNGKPVGLIDITDVLAQSDDQRLRATPSAHGLRGAGGETWRARTVRFPDSDAK
jgi:arabinose-5-phosphate isomerase